MIKEYMMKKSMPPPFPQALRSKKKVRNQTEILEVLSDELKTHLFLVHFSVCFSFKYE